MPNMNSPLNCDAGTLLSVLSTLANLLRSGDIVAYNSVASLVNRLYAMGSTNCWFQELFVLNCHLSVRLHSHSTYTVMSFSRRIKLEIQNLTKARLYRCFFMGRRIVMMLESTRFFLTTGHSMPLSEGRMTLHSKGASSNCSFTWKKTIPSLLPSWSLWRRCIIPTSVVK